METNLAALEDRLARFVHRKAVEKRTTHRIDRRNFHRCAATHVADGDLVIEINRARIAWRDFRRLRAGFGKYQALRVGIDFEIVEQSRQVTRAIGAWLEMRAREFGRGI